MWKLISLILSLLFAYPTPVPTRKPEITLIVTGDVLPARTINARSVELNDFTWPWTATRTLLESADISYINLETPLIADCPISRTGTIFCGDLRSVQGLKFSGIDVANLANNHIDNFGQRGTDSTVKVLEENGILTSGIQTSFMDVKGQSIAFLGFNAVPLTTKREKISSDIATAKKQSDLVIVQFHWGNEYTTKITDLQKSLAYLAIDSGADLVIGNHPHWVQPEEIYRGKVIKYALGNFIFDQFWSPGTLQGEVGKFVFSNGQLIYHEYLPVQIDGVGQPHLLNTK